MKDAVPGNDEVKCSARFPGTDILLMKRSVRVIAAASLIISADTSMPVTSYPCSSKALTTLPPVPQPTSSALLPVVDA